MNYRITALLDGNWNCWMYSMAEGGEVVGMVLQYSDLKDLPFCLASRWDGVFSLTRGITHLPTVCSYLLLMLLLVQIVR